MHKENNIKEWLLPKLRVRNLTVEQFANIVGVTRATIYFYLSDTCRPDLSTMVKICNELNVPLEEGLQQYIPRLVGRPGGRKRREKFIG